MFLLKGFGSVNWTNVMQSVKDTWLPMLGIVICIGLIIYIFNSLTKKNKR